jgi:PhnB protein
MEIGIQVYVHKSADAVALYQQAFNAQLGYHVRNTDGSFFHAELEVDGRSFLAVSEADATVGRLVLESVSPQLYPPMNFGVTLADAAAVQQAFDVLAEGGAVLLPVSQLPWSECAANVVDRFGVFWYLSVLQHRPDDDELDIS